MGIRPLVLPASTTLAALAGALTVLIVGILDRYGANLSQLEAQSITVVITVLTAHFVIDSPPPTIARQAVAAVADIADAAGKP